MDRYNNNKIIKFLLYVKIEPNNAAVTVAAVVVVAVAVVIEYILIPSYSAFSPPIRRQ